MNCTDNPIGVLAECIAHAQYQGFSDIAYEFSSRWYGQTTWFELPK